VNRYYLRSLETVEARALPGTEGAYVPAAWTADSRFVIFTVLGSNELRKVDIQGGPPQVLGTIQGIINGASTNEETIVFASSLPGLPLFRIPTAGGAPVPVTAFLDGDNDHQFPQFLPDGQRFLYFVGSTNPDRRGMYVGSLDAGPEAQSTVRLLATDRQAYYASPTGSGPGHLIMMRGTTLLAQPFDWQRLAFSGEAVPIAQNVDSFAPRNYGLFSVSGNGALVYRGGAGSGFTVASFDETGRPQRSFGEPGVYSFPAVSPDGTRIAVTRGAAGESDIWIVDTVRDTTQRFTFDPANDYSPVWSPDGTSIAFGSDRSGQPQLYVKPADGLREEVLLTDQPGVPTSWSRDGQHLLFTSGSPANDLWVLSDPGETDATAFALLDTEFNELDGRLSPDGRWIAYESNESSLGDIFVRRFSPDGDAGGAKYLVSRSASRFPRWSRDGGQLFYVDAANLDIMAVDVEAGAAFEASTPRPLFTGPAPLLSGWSPTPAGGYVFIATPEDRRPAPFTVVLNWEASLNR
jgi:Tol biopolymer transport system component